MVFGLAVLIGALFIYVGVRLGFFATWIMFFNLLLSVYVAIFLTPLLLDSIPAANDIPGGCALTLLCTAAATMLIGYGICYACLSGEFYAEYPAIFDTVVSGVLGFLAGFLACSFLTLAFCLTPLSQFEICATLGAQAKLEPQKTNTAYVCWWCNGLHSFLGVSDSQFNAEKVVKSLCLTAGVIEPEKPKSLPPPPPRPSDMKLSDIKLSNTKPSDTKPGVLQAMSAKPNSSVKYAGNPFKKPDAENKGGGRSDDATIPPINLPASPGNTGEVSTPDDFMRQELEGKRAIINVPDTLTQELDDKSVSIVQISDACTLEKFSDEQTQLLKRWVSSGGVLWANNNVLELFGIRHSRTPIESDQLDCLVNKDGAFAGMFDDTCCNVALQQTKGKVSILPSKGIVPLLTLKKNRSDDRGPSVPSWSLAKYGTGWVSDPKPVDALHGDGAQFWRTFCIFCLTAKTAPPPIGNSAIDVTPPTPRNKLGNDNKAQGDASSAPSKDALTGIWKGSDKGWEGQRFRLDDDGAKITIRLAEGQGAVKSLEGEMTRQGESEDSFKGSFTLAFPKNAKQYTVSFTAKLDNSHKLHFKCSQFPVVQKDGFVIGPGERRLIWTR